MVSVASNKQDEVIRQEARNVLATGMSGLQFASVLEQHFESWHRHRYLTLNRVYLLTGALAMAVLTASDKIITPSIIDQIIAIRIPVILLILFVFTLSHLKFTVSRLPGLICLGACALQSSMLITNYYAAQAGYFHYQGGAIVVIVFVCLMLKIQFQYVFPLAILLWFTQVLGMYFFMAQPFAEFIEVFVLYTVVTVISLVVCFRSEIEVRRFFILQTLLRTKVLVSPDRSKPQPAILKDNSTVMKTGKASAPLSSPKQSPEDRSADAESDRKDHVVRSMFRASDRLADTQVKGGPRLEQDNR